MRAFSNKRKRTAAVAGLGALTVFLIASWYLTAPYRGWLAAQVDARGGHYRLLAYGRPPRENDEYVRLLRERYDIEVDRVAFCTPSWGIVAYADSYDRVSYAAANRKFGHDVFKEAWEEVEDESSS